MKKNQRLPPKNHGVFQLGKNVIHTGAIIYDTNPNIFFVGGEFLKTTNTCARLSIPPYLMTPVISKVNHENLVGLPSWWAPFFQCLSLHPLSVHSRHQALWRSLRSPTDPLPRTWSRGDFSNFSKQKNDNNPTGKKNRHIHNLQLHRLSLKPPQKITNTPVFLDSFFTLRIFFGKKKSLPIFGQKKNSKLPPTSRQALLLKELFLKKRSHLPRAADGCNREVRTDRIKWWSDPWVRNFTGSPHENGRMSP